MPSTAAPAAPVAPLSPTQVAALDDAQSLNEFTDWQVDGDGRREGHSRLLISGMVCAACSVAVEEALTRLPGVRSAEVSGATQRALVTWDPAQATASQLVAAVQRAGYGAYPDTGAQAATLAARESRSAVWRLFVAAFCMMQVMMYAAPAYVTQSAEMGADIVLLLRWASWVLTVPVLVFAAGPYFRGAWHGLRQRRIGMDLPVALGIGVTFVASSVVTFQAGAGGEVYFDSLTMFVTFLLAARVLEARARRRAAQALDAVMRQLPDTVERLDVDGEWRLVRPAQLAIGDRVRVQVGQAFAADGRVIEGRTEVDESMLTGESLPVPRGVGDEVAAGCLNLGAPVLVQVVALGVQTRYQRIVAMVERALMQRPAFVVAADRWAGPFLWGVLLLAAAGWAAWQFIDPARAVWVAVSVLIVTCPCALSLGAPVALLAAAGELARRGVLVQRLDALEVLTRAGDWVFDKTGTLTEDRLGLAHSVSLSCAASEPACGWTAFAASLAAHSGHPLSRALRQAAAQPAVSPVDLPAWQTVREVPGLGLEAAHVPAVGQPARVWRLGSAAWCGVAPSGDSLTSPGRPAVWLACDSAAGWQPQARFEFDEALRTDAVSALQALREAGRSLHLLSGDQPRSVADMASRLGFDHARVQARCTPQDKLAAVQALQDGGRTVVMVGDGINDAPVLARADVSVAMGSAAALAQARADVIVLGNRLSDLVLLQHTAVRALRIVRQNLAWAVAYNLASVPLALVGWLPPWLAGIGMAASSLGVVLNALRLTRRPRQRGAPATPNAAEALPLTKPA